MRKVKANPCLPRRIPRRGYSDEEVEEMYRMGMDDSVPEDRIGEDERPAAWGWWL